MHGFFSRDAESGKPIGQLEKSEMWKKVLSLKEKDELAKRLSFRRKVWGRGGE